MHELLAGFIEHDRAAASQSSARSHIHETITQALPKESALVAGLESVLDKTSTE